MQNEKLKASIQSSSHVITRFFIPLAFFLLSFALLAVEQEPAPVQAVPPIERILGKTAEQWIEHLAGHENEQERKIAMLCLQDFGPASEGAAPELRALMKDELQPETRRFAMVTLGAIGPAAREAVPMLLQVLNDAAQPPAHRAAACAAVARIQPETKAVQAAVLAALRDNSVDVRAEAIDAAATIAPFDPSAISALGRALSQPEDAHNAAVALSCLGRKGFQPLAKALERGGKETRLAAAEALSRMPGVRLETLEALWAAVHHERNPQTREALLTAADHLQMRNANVPAAASEDAPPASPASNDGNDIPALIASLKSENGEARLRALHALRAEGSAAAGATVIFLEMAEGVSDSEASAAIEALGAIGPAAFKDASPSLLRILEQDLSASRRAQAAYALAAISTHAGDDVKKIIDSLLKALFDPDESVCRAAHEALVTIGESALPPLREILKLDPVEAPYWVVRVMAELKADPQDIIPRLIDLTLPGKRPIERATAVEMLGYYAPEHAEIIPILLRILCDREDYVARAAIRTLKLFSPPPAAALEQFLQSRNPLLRKRAIDALDTLRVREVNPDRNVPQPATPAH